MIIKITKLSKTFYHTFLFHIFTPIKLFFKGSVNIFTKIKKYYMHLPAAKKKNCIFISSDKFRNKALAPNETPHLN